MTLPRKANQANNYNCKNNQMNFKMSTKDYLSNSFVNFWKFSVYYGRFISDHPASVKSEQTKLECTS